MIKATTKKVIGTSITFLKQVSTYISNQVLRVIYSKAICNIHFISKATSNIHSKSSSQNLYIVKQFATSILFSKHIHFISKFNIYIFLNKLLNKYFNIYISFSNSIYSKETYILFSCLLRLPLSINFMSLFP